MAGEVDNHAHVVGVAGRFAAPPPRPVQGHPNPPPPLSLLAPSSRICGPRAAHAMRSTLKTLSWPSASIASSSDHLSGLKQSNIGGDLHSSSTLQFLGVLALSVTLRTETLHELRWTCSDSHLASPGVPSTRSAHFDPPLPWIEASSKL